MKTETREALMDATEGAELAATDAGDSIIIAIELTGPRGALGEIAAAIGEHAKLWAESRIGVNIVSGETYWNRSLDAMRGQYGGPDGRTA